MPEGSVVFPAMPNQCVSGGLGVVDGPAARGIACEPLSNEITAAMIRTTNQIQRRQFSCSAMRATFRAASTLARSRSFWLAALFSASSASAPQRRRRSSAISISIPSRISFVRSAFSSWTRISFLHVDSPSLSARVGASCQERMLQVLLVDYAGVASTAEPETTADGRTASHFRFRMMGDGLVGPRDRSDYVPLDECSREKHGAACASLPGDQGVLALDSASLGRLYPVGIGRLGARSMEVCTPVGDRQSGRWPGPARTQLRARGGDTKRPASAMKRLRESSRLPRRAAMVAESMVAVADALTRSRALSQDVPTISSNTGSSPS